jgi:membrane protein implicated in regulation of membrane protease activity
MKGAVMSSETTQLTRTEIVDEVSKWGVGIGIVTMSLFVFSLPFLILTVVALLPLVVPLLAVGLVGAVVAAPIVLVRRLVRRARRRTGRTASSQRPQPLG